MVQYTKIDANRCVLKPFWGVLEAFWGKNGVFWGDFRVGRRGFWIEKWDERGDGRWDSGEKSWWAGGFLDSFYLCKISPHAWTAVFLHFRRFFFRFRRAVSVTLPWLSLLLVVAFGGACLLCLYVSSFSNYSFCFNNPINSFQYYILQLYTLHHYYAFTLYIPIIHNFFLYHTLFTFISIIHSIIFFFILLVHFCTVSCFYICSIGTII